MAKRSRETDLKALLGRLSAAPERRLNAAEVDLLATSVAHPGSSTDHSLAFLCLSRNCQGVAAEPEEARVERVTSTFQPFVEPVFAPPVFLSDPSQATGDPEDVAPKPDSYVPAVCLLTAIYPFAPTSATALLTHPLGPPDPPPPDPLAVLLEAAELASPLQRPFAELLASAAGTKQGKALVRSRCLDWLRGAVDYGEDKDLGVICAVALSKLGRAEVASGANGAEDADTGVADAEGEEEILCRKMMGHIASVGTLKSPNRSTLLPTLEGLSVLSTWPAVKDILISDIGFIRALLALSPVPTKQPGSMPVTPRASLDFDKDFESKLFEPVETSLCYGIATILFNLTAKRPQLSAEDQQIARLRQMAVSGKAANTEPEEDARDGDEAVEGRTGRLVQAGVVSALHGLVRAESRLVKDTLGQLCLHLVDDKAHRIPFVRDGGFKVLSSLIREVSTNQASATGTGLASSSDGDADRAASLLPAAQALAKLVITTNPTLLFPPPSTTTCLNALNPLYTLLTSPSSTLLQRFEALMALTNLASIDSSIADRIVEASLAPPKEDGLFRGSGREERIQVLGKVEELMLDDNTFCRRAATELVCNLVGSPKGWAHFTGDGQSGQSAARVQSRLNVLLVLTNVGDLPTRLAAGGALAVLTESSGTCQALIKGSREIEDEKKRTRSVWSRALRMLRPDEATGGDSDEDGDGEEIPVITSALPNPALVHRGVIILLNLATYAVGKEDQEKKEMLKEAKDAGLENDLMAVLRMKMPAEVLQPAVECVKLLRQHA